MAIVMKVLIVVALVCGVLALFGVKVLGLQPVELAALGVVALAAAALI